MRDDLIISDVQFDLVAHLHRQRDFSHRAFGAGARMEVLHAHIRKELDEIAAEPADVNHWIDVALLALDGACRAGHTPEEIAVALGIKQGKNEARFSSDSHPGDRKKDL